MAGGGGAQHLNLGRRRPWLWSRGGGEEGGGGYRLLEHAAHSFHRKMPQAWNGACSHFQYPHFCPHPPRPRLRLMLCAHYRQRTFHVVAL